MLDKVVKITGDGEYNGRPKWKVQLQNNGEYTFFTNFDAKVGDQIDFNISNPKYKTAKLISVSNQTASKPKSNYDTGQSILRQVAFKGAIELAINSKIDIAEIENFTNEFHNLLNK